MLAGTLNNTCTQSETINLKQLEANTVHAVDASVVVEDASGKDFLDTVTELLTSLFLIQSLIDLTEDLYEDLGCNRVVSFNQGHQRKQYVLVVYLYVR